MIGMCTPQNKTMADALQAAPLAKLINNGALLLFVTICLDKNLGQIFCKTFSPTYDTYQ